MKTTFIKKFICISLVLTLLLCGCNTVPNGEENTTEGSVTQAVKKEPIQSVSVAPENAVIPFLGGIVASTPSYGDLYLYGLMTPQGEIVVEPIYEEWYLFENGDEAFYCMKNTDQLTNSETPDCLDSTLYSLDGTKLLTLEHEIVYLDSDRIVTKGRGTQKIAVYDRGCNFVFGTAEGENAEGIFSEGLMLIVTQDKPNYVVDKNGDTVIDGVYVCKKFTDGKAIFSDANDFYGIISADDKQLMEPYCNDIYRYQDYFICEMTAYFEVYSEDLELLATADHFKNWHYNFEFATYKGRAIYRYTAFDGEKEPFRDLLTNETVDFPKGFTVERVTAKDDFFIASKEDGTSALIDTNGKILLRDEDVSDTKYDNVLYSAHYDETNAYYTYYNALTLEKIIELSYDTQQKMRPVHGIVEGCDYVAVGDLDFVIETLYEGTFGLYNYKTGKYVFEGCENCFIENHFGTIYITVAYKDKIQFYNNDLELIKEISNALEGEF